MLIYLVLPDTKKKPSKVKSLFQIGYIYNSLEKLINPMRPILNCNHNTGCVWRILRENNGTVSDIHAVSCNSCNGAVFIPNWK